MKVKELIEKLQKENQDAEVFTEGCDCIGDSYNVVKTQDYFKDNPVNHAESGCHYCQVWWSIK